MELFNKLKNFLGFARQEQGPDTSSQNRTPHVWEDPESEESFTETFPGRNFQMFTDPLEIHRYFEKQMRDMLRIFGFEEFGDGFTHHFDNQVEIEEIPEVPAGELRDQFLKPGYEKQTLEKKIDEDIDGKMIISDLDSILHGNSRQPSPLAPNTRQNSPNNYFFGQSTTSKTIMNPDGSIETSRTIRDNEGNEETTVTRKIGDKEYTVIKRRNKDGKEEIIENLINLNEDEVRKLFPQQPKIPELDNKPYN